MNSSDNKKVLVLSCITYFCLGVSLAVIGPILAELASNAQVSISTAGTLFSALFTGALLAQLVSGPIIDHFGHKVVLWTSVLTIGLGMLCFTFVHSIWLLLFFVFLGGIGHGGADLGANVLVSQVFASRNVAAMNLLNFFYGLGAFLGPALVGFAYSVSNSGLIVPAVNAILLVILFPFILRLNVPEQPQKKSGRKFKIPALYRTAPIWIFGILILIYVGAENGLSGWISSYMTQTVAYSLESAALVSAGYWLALTLGRLINAGIAMFWSPIKMLIATMCSALLGSILFAISAGNPILTILGILLTGLGFGAIYPTVMAIINTTYAGNAGKAASLVAALGSGGGILFPWLQGVILEHFGPSASAWFVLTLVILMICTFIFNLTRPGHPYQPVQGISE